MLLIGILILLLIIKGLSGNTERQEPGPVLSPAVKKLLGSSLDYKVPSTQIKKKPVVVSGPNPLEWWPCDDKRLPEPSAAERIIIRCLNKYRVKWYREVCFRGLPSKNGYLRYDFLLKLPGSVHLIEYDGKGYHSDPERVAVDKKKTAFCNRYGVSLTRYNSKDYYKMDERIHELMSGYGITLK